MQGNILANAFLPFFAAGLLATFVEGFIEYFVADFKVFKPAPEGGGLGYILKYAALLFAVGIAIWFKIDILSAIGVPVPSPLAGWLVTGVIMSRGANYFNDFVSKWRADAGKTGSSA